MTLHKIHPRNLKLDPLPPLPPPEDLVGDPDGFPLLVDSTILASYASCPWRAHQEYFRHWKAKRPSVHLHAGRAFARGLEVLRREYYEGELTPSTALEKAEVALAQEWGDQDLFSTEAKNLPRTVGALSYYATHAWPLSSEYLKPYHWTPTGQPRQLAVEVSFCLPVPGTRHPTTGDPVLVGGRFDQIVEHNGLPFNLDDKTTGSLGVSWASQWETRGQFLCYAWAMRAMGIPVAGTVVRGIAILKTKYAHAQAVVFHPEHLLERWEWEMTTRVNNMVRDWDSGEWERAYGAACNTYGRCPFTAACLAREPEAWLPTKFTRRVWNPLARQEVSL